MNINRTTLYRHMYVLVLFVILIAIIVVVLRPIIYDIRHLRQSIITEREKLEQLYVRGQLLRKTQEQLYSIEQEVPQLSLAALPSSEKLTLITALENAANKYNLEQHLTLDELTPDNVSAGDVVTLPITVSLTGQFRNVLAYIVAVERFDFYVNWQSVEIRTNSRSTQQGRTFSRQIFGQPEGIESPATEPLHAVLTGETFWRQ